MSPSLDRLSSSRVEHTCEKRGPRHQRSPDYRAGARQTTRRGAVRRTLHRIPEGQGYSVKNNPDDQAKAAFRLRDTCEYTELQIETTLSRFEQAGGFDAYSPEDLLIEPKEW